MWTVLVIIYFRHVYLQFIFPPPARLLTTECVYYFSVLKSNISIFPPRHLGKEKKWIH